MAMIGLLSLDQAPTHPFHRPNSPTQAPSPKLKERCTGRAMRSKRKRKLKHGEDVDNVGSIDTGLILRYVFMGFGLLGLWVSDMFLFFFFLAGVFGSSWHGFFGV